MKGNPKSSIRQAPAREPCVAYLGPSATFTHEAARLQFGDSISLRPAASIPDVFALVENGTVRWGVVPIENSTEGAVTHTLDELAGAALQICGEIYLPISHCLLSRGVRARIRRIYSHPQVFGQCRHRLRTDFPDVDLIPVASTARAAELAASEPGSGALAAKLAAAQYGLAVRQAHMEDNRANSTRFLVLGTASHAPTGRDKTSLLFRVEHRAGALVSALSVLRRHGINLTRIESRPAKVKAWEYVFFVDFEGHADDPRIRRALTALQKPCAFCKILGSYPAVSPTGGG